MTLRHIAAIYFSGHREGARKRIHRLVAHGYLSQRPRNPGEPGIYSLTRMAFEALRREGKVERSILGGSEQHAKRFQVSRLTLEHELGVLDCMTALVVAIRERPAFSLGVFSTWPQRLQFQTFHPESRRPVTVKPDGYLCFQNEASQCVRFFLEVDRSTETLDSLVGRIASYRSFYRQGGMAKRLGYDPEVYRRFPLRVIITCKSAQRRQLLAERLEALHPPIRGFVCVATANDFLMDPLDVLKIGVR